MPMNVPTIDQTTMAAQPVAAPTVAPMRNYAPEQMQQSGQAVQQAGGVAMRIGQTIGDHLTEQVNLATTKQAETSFLQQSDSILNDAQNGYLHQLGKAAIDGAGAAKQALAKAQQDGRDGLNNPLQRQMFDQVTNQHMIGFGKAISDHNYVQTQQYAGDAAVSRAKTSTDAAAAAVQSYGQTDAEGAATGEYAKNLATAEQETLDAVRIMKGAPADSDVAKGALLQLHTQIGTGVVSQLMDARAPYSKVQGVFDDLKQKGFLDIRTMDALGKMVKTYSDQESTRSAVNQNLTDAVRASQGLATSSTGTPDYQFPVRGATTTAQPYDPSEGAVTVNLPKASAIQAPADGKVVQVGKDDNGTFGMQIQHADGSVTTFSGLSAANVKAGDRVQGGEDVAVGAGPAVLWSLADKNGNTVDPTKAGLPPVDLTKVTDEKVLGSALDRLRKQITDPYLQQQATAEMESMVRHNQGMANAAKVQDFSAASDAFYKGGMQWRHIPPTLFNSLSAEQQQHFKDAQTQKVLQDYSQGQAFKEMSSTDIQADFALHPEMVTPENVDRARAQLPNSVYLSYMQQAGRQAKDPQYVQEATGISDRIKYFAGPAGVNIEPKSIEDKQSMVDLTYKVNNAIDQIKSQNKGKATPQQVDDAIKQQLIQRTVLTPRAWGALNPMSLLGSPNTSTQKYSFQMPYGATHVVPGSDGKMHYTDGTNDLGAVK